VGPVSAATAGRRIAFLDFDGTVADDRGVIPASAVEAIVAARRNGHLVVLATGRSRGQLPDAVHAIGFDALITASGAFTEADGVPLVEHVLPETDVARLVAAFDRLDLEYLLQGFDHDYGTEGLLMRVAAHPAWGTGPHPDLSVLASLPVASRDSPVAKALFVGLSAAAVGDVAAALGSDFSVITGTMPILGSAAGEVMAVGVDKGAAAADLLRRYGIDAAQAVAVGDSRNDLELFELCGASIAMAGAPDEIRARADLVTTGVDEDGLRRALESQSLV